MRVLITGADGAIGPWVVKSFLKQKAAVCAFIHSDDPDSELFRSGDAHEIKLIEGDVTDFGSLEYALKTYKPNAVIHLGAQTQVQVAVLNPLETFETNIRGTYNLLEACRMHNIISSKRHADTLNAIVIASSDKAYGSSNKKPYTEDFALLGQNPYDVSKVCTDVIAQTYASTYGLPIGILRCGNVYGGGDRNWERLIPSVIKSLMHGERPVLRSDGTPVRDYIYVEDVARAYVLLTEKLVKDSGKSKAAQIYNIGTGKGESALEITQLLIDEFKALGLVKRPDLKPVIKNQAVHEISYQVLNSKKANGELQWRAKVSLEAGLKKSIKWYAEFFAASAAHAKNSKR